MRADIQKILNEAKVLILDIETDSLDVETATAKVVGVRTNKNNKTHCIWHEDFDKLRKAIKGADFVVTYNGNNFDIPVLMNKKNKLFKYKSSIEKKHIDLYEVVKSRESTFKVHFDNFKLDTVCETLGLSRKIDDFDYGLLQKDVLTATEKAEIESYLEQDINITYELYEFIEHLYDAFTEFLPKDDVVKKRYITSSMGAITYKIVCHLSNREPVYNDAQEHVSYKGGLVIDPAQESAEGNILCADFTSAYPHAFMQANLYTKCTYCIEGYCPHRFTGGKLPNGDELKLQGAYCQKNGMGDIEKVIQKLFRMRLNAKQKVKNGDDVEYNKKLVQAIKIIINTIYGISGSPKFVQTFDIDTASDCTKICRFNLKYLHKRIEDFGHEVLYGDSVAGDTMVDILGYGQVPIESLFTQIDFVRGNKEYCILNYYTPSITDKLKYTVGRVSYVMRHKTNKKMYRVWGENHKYVDVTEDHSLITFKNGGLIECKPTNIRGRIVSYENNHKFGLMDISKIEEIEYDSYVYDIEVEGTHKFFANSILVHNTDSCYFKSLHSEDVVEKQLETIADEIKSIFPQPQTTFNIELEEPMKYIKFFYDDRGNSKKKQYIKLMRNNDVDVKGLAIIKRDSSFLARKVWQDKIVPDIKAKGKLDVTKAQVELWIDELIHEDINNAKIEFNIKPFNEYATETSIQAILSRELGPGKHAMVKTTKNIGYGKGVKYVPLEQAKNFTVKDLDLTRVWSDLNDLINKEQMTFEYFMV